MAHKYAQSGVVIRDGGIATHPGGPGEFNSWQLSDGTLVWMAGLSGAIEDPAIYWSSDHATVNTLGTSTLTSGMSLCVDALDNVYVVGKSGAGYGGQCFTKGVGYSWTAQTAVTRSGSAVTTPFNSVLRQGKALWANVGGTAGAGLILWFVARNSGGFTGLTVLDAGVLQAGSGTVQVAQTASPMFMQQGNGFVGEFIDAEPDSFGAASGVFVSMDGAATTAQAGRWAVNSSGALTTNTTITTTGLAFGGGSVNVGRLRVRSAGAGVFAVAGEVSTGNKVAVARISTSAVLTASAAYGTVTGVPALSGATPPRNWDVVYDPGSGKVWLYCPASSPANTVLRLGCSVGSGVVWDSVAVSDDTAVGTAPLGFMRTPQRVADFTHVDYQANDSVPKLVGDYSVLNAAPNAPTLTNPVGASTIDLTAANTFTWNFDDPNVGDTQSAYELQYRIVGAGSWTTTGMVTSTTSSRTVAGGTFTADDFEWQVRTWDSYGVVGPWSSSAFFTAATPPTGPTITGPTAGATITALTTPLTWSVPAQASYQARKVADSGGSPDTGTVYFDTGEVVNAVARTVTLSFPTNGRYEHLQLRVKDAGLWSTWASVRVHVAYTPPATPTAVVMADTPSGAVTVSATHPAPSGSQPTVTSFNVWRRRYGTSGAGIRVAVDVAPAGSFTDWAVASGVAYEYLVEDVGDNTTTAFSAWVS